jgi:hypothetical protein
MRFLSAGIFSPHSAWSRSPGESLEAQPAPETVWVSFIVSKLFIIFIKFFGLYHLEAGILVQYKGLISLNPFFSID